MFEQFLVDRNLHRIVLRIEQHRRAQAVLTSLALQDRIVHATLASFPELVVVGQLGINDRAVTQLGIDLHHGHAGGQPEKLRSRKHLQREEKRLGLDRLGQPQLSELRVDNQSRIGEQDNGLWRTYRGVVSVVIEGKHKEQNTKDVIQL